jgi:hypothetical protein
VLAEWGALANAGSMKLAPVLLLVLCGAANADGLTARFGMTFSPLMDESIPDGDHEIGPQVAIGSRLGRFVGEVEWAYLSLFDPLASPGGVHRLGVTLRADVWRDTFLTHCSGSSAIPGECTHGKSLYVEAGAAERIGKWVVQPTEEVPLNSPQPEVHLGVGWELDNSVSPHRNGWQVGLRYSVARGDELTSVACRSTGGVMCTNGQALATKSGVQHAVFIEWMFLLGN